MDTLTRHNLIHISILFIITISFFLYTEHTAQQLNTEFNNKITVLKEQLSTTQKELDNEINTLETKVTTENQKLEQQITGSITTVQEKIDQTRQQQQNEINNLGNKVAESTEKLSTFEEQLKNVNIKNKDFTMIIKDILKTVVTIKTDKAVGSGVIIDDSGYLVTNYHVLDGASQAALRTYDNKLYPVQVIGAEKNADIAVIKINPTLPLKALGFERTKINIGDKVIAVGNPAGLEFSVTEGIISATERINNNGIKYIQTDVPINPGNSGGPLVNIYGKIVGINTMKKSDMEGIGFAVHAAVVEDIAEHIIQEYEKQQTT